MYKETINKLQNNINSNLSIEELKILYGIDIEDYCNSDYLEISKYRNNRNKYEIYLKYLVMIKLQLI